MASYWIDTLVLKNCGKYLRCFTTSPFPLQGKTNAVLKRYHLVPGLQKCFERHGAYEMFQELKLVFQTHAHVERYETFDKHFAYKMEENCSASEHVLRMSEYYNHLNQVGVNLPDKIVIDRVL